jgi:hypothetical protein
MARVSCFKSSLQSQQSTLSLRSRRQHKAWGVSPRMRSWKCPSPHERATDGTQQTALIFHLRKRILKLNPNYPLVHYRLGQAYERKGEDDGARGV